MNACIIIPIYKPFYKLDVYELTSIIQAYSILSNHQFYLICSSSLNTRDYENHALSQNIKVEIKRFPSRYFENIKGYNSLMLASKFYREFQRYHYMLIHQTDAYVFRDEINRWCAVGVDYVGAPWIKEDGESHELILDQCGNGGFSLRNVKKHYSLSKHIEKLQLLDGFLRYSVLSLVLPTDNILLNFWKTRFQPKIGFNIRMLTSGFYAQNEDGNWSINIALSSHNFNVATPQLALQFSFEQHPEILFEKNERKLPFGCHAFSKYNWPFWSKFISLESK